MKNEKVQLVKFVPGGQALGVLLNGKKVFVWGGLPGEEVEIEITKSKKSYAEGIVNKVIEPSLSRIEPRDECFLSTSPWQVLDWEYELEQKAELVKEAFRQQGIRITNQDVRIKDSTARHCEDPALDSQSGAGDVEIQCDGIIQPIATDGKQFGYRNKMEYSLYWDKETEKVELAFHKRGSHQKVPISHSSIELPEILERAKYIINGINDKGLQARQFSSLMIRANQAGEVRSMLFEKNKPHVQGEKLTDTIMDHEYSYSPNGFFQINLPVYEMALQQMKKYVTDGEVLELYAGVGTIGLSIANSCHPTPAFPKSGVGSSNKLTMVESDKNAFKELENNVKSFQNSQIKAINAKSEDVLEYIKYDINTLILDPPRAGLDSKVVEKTLQTLPNTIIYLSCNPITQARDIALLSEKYQITLIQPYNFFPRTPHIENLVVLSALD